MHSFARQAWVCGACTLLLLLAPMLFSESASLSLLSQMGIMILFGLSYNMLLGQGGMLSFYHAIYSGLGAFMAIHVMNHIGVGTLALPMSVIPLVGGIAGMVFGVLFGYVITRRTGTTFAMITLGMGELVSACVLMFPTFFGGEGGISGDRTSGPAWFGVTYRSQIEVYYLIAFWLWISAVAMYAFTQTPLGRIINAVRDNPERTAFIGYNPQMVRYLILILSAFFAGVSGGLSAINFEIVSVENVGALKSGAVLLFTFIGGAGYFFGPVIGAVIGVLFSMLLPAYTLAWQLYLGVFFIVMVMFAPQGMAHIAVIGVRMWRDGSLAYIWKPLCGVILSLLLMLTGGVAMVEMCYRLSFGMDLLGGSVFASVWDGHDLGTWGGACAALLMGWFAMLRLRAPLAQARLHASHVAAVKEAR